MNADTHMLGGLLAGAAVLPVLGPEHMVALLAAAALSAPLPDIDHPGSMYGRWVPLPGVVRVGGRIEPYRRGLFGNSERSFGHVGRRTPFGILWHRGPTHSIAIALGFGGAAFILAGHAVPALALPVGLGVLAGYLSHLALDEMNVSGMRLLWPFRRGEVRLRWPHIRVGSVGETGVGLVIAAALFAVFWRDLVLTLLPR